MRALEAKYIIDGIAMDASPEEMLSSAMGRECPEPGQESETIVDESFDPSPSSSAFFSGDIRNYLKTLTSIKPDRDAVPLEYPQSASRKIIARCLIETIWKSGHFKLGDLSVETDIKWDCAPLGSMAALYRSIESLCDYLDGLGIRLSEWTYEEGRECLIAATVKLSGDGDLFSEDESAYPDEPVRLEERRAVPECADNSKDPTDWIIYIPFDTCNYSLGGSALARSLSLPGGKGVETNDPDYFMDCYEVVRELVEDGIVKSGVTVSDGGLMAALSVMTGNSFSAEIGSIMKSYGESDIVRILFGEVPGVIVSIKDSDYDYVDAELLLQDVAYYPLGQRGKKREGIEVRISEISGISGILQSLLGEQAAEGED